MLPSQECDFLMLPSLLQKGFQAGDKDREIFTCIRVTAANVYLLLQHSIINLHPPQASEQGSI